MNPRSPTNTILSSSRPSSSPTTSPTTTAASTTTTNGTTTGSGTFSRLPNELLELVVQHCDVADQGRLARTSREMRSAVEAFAYADDARSQSSSALRWAASRGAAVAFDRALTAARAHRTVNAEGDAAEGNEPQAAGKLSWYWYGPDREQLSAFGHACASGHVALARQLAAISQPSLLACRRALMHALDGGHWDACRLLIDMMAPQDGAKAALTTAFVVAAQSAPLDILDKFLEACTPGDRPPFVWLALVGLMVQDWEPAMLRSTVRRILLLMSHIDRPDTFVLEVRDRWTGELTNDVNAETDLLQAFGDWHPGDALANWILSGNFITLAAFDAAVAALSDDPPPSLPGPRWVPEYTWTAQGVRWARHSPRRLSMAANDGRKGAEADLYCSYLQRERPIGVSEGIRELVTEVVAVEESYDRVHPENFQWGRQFRDPHFCSEWYDSHDLECERGIFFCRAIRCDKSIGVAVTCQNCVLALCVDCHRQWHRQDYAGKWAEIGGEIVACDEGLTFQTVEEAALATWPYSGDDAEGSKPSYVHDPAALTMETVLENWDDCLENTWRRRRRSTGVI